MSSDRLSGLPEDIISHILSLMPTKYAVRTSVLSKRWRYSWMYVNNLDFDNDIRTIPVLTKLVDGVLKQRKSSQIKLFRLHFYKLRIKSSSVLSWINGAVKLNVNELDIKVIGLGFSLSMLTCKTLTTLRLSCFQFVDCEFPCHVNLPCLKTLDVVVYTDPYAYVFKLIGGCPMLEILSMEVSWGVTAGDYIFNIPTLKRLKLIRTSSRYCNKVVLNVPNLEHLFVGGLLYSNFVMEDVSSLVEASISFGEIKFYHVWVELLKGLIGVKSLSVQILNSDIDYKTFFSSSLPLFPKVKHLKLKGCRQSRQIPQFLESFPELKHLCIEIVVDPFFEKPKEYSWVEPKLVPACMLMKLTTIKFLVCEWWKCELPFLKYMLGNAEVLKTVAVTWEKLCLEEEQTELCEELLKFPRAREKLCLEEEQTQLREELLKFPRASRCCEIQFHGN